MAQERGPALTNMATPRASTTATTANPSRTIAGRTGLALLPVRELEERRLPRGERATRPSLVKLIRLESFRRFRWALKFAKSRPDFAYRQV